MNLTLESPILWFVSTEPAQQPTQLQVILPDGPPTTTGSGIDTFPMVLVLTTSLVVAVLVICGLVIVVLVVMLKRRRRRTSE